MTLILASMSAARRAMLDAAGVIFDAMAPLCDEDAVKTELLAQHLVPAEIALALAEAKAASIANAHPAAWVLGSDQTLECEEGTMLDKPGKNLAAQLRLLSGKTHRLHSAATIMRDGEPIWRGVETVTLTMRVLGEAFIADYVTREGAAVAGCVGGYRIEGPGVALFDRIEGSHFAILGLPLLPLLAFLRDAGLMAV